jgi:hypothetical protein
MEPAVAWNLRLLRGADGVDFIDGGLGTDICRTGETVVDCE